MDDSAYGELHCRSWYSFGRGASSVDELVVRAAKLGYQALALTDRDNLTGVLELAEAARAAGIKPIVGAEVTVAHPELEPAPITLLAENAAGYSNLCRLISSAHRAGERRHPQLDPGELSTHGEGLIALLGSPGGHLARHLDSGHLAAARGLVAGYCQQLGSESVFIELQRHLAPGELARNRALAELAGQLGVGVVATGGVCYHDRSRHRLGDVLTAIRLNTTLDGCHRQRHPNANYHLRPTEEMTRLFRRWPQALENSARIARRCMAFSVGQIRYRLPQPPVPEGFAGQQAYFEHVCRIAARERYGRITPTLQARLQKEFDLIAKHDLAGFFLLYRQVIEMARQVAVELGHLPPGAPLSQRAPGRGRGSSVAMLTGTLIGLSHVDPLEYDLPLERFLPADHLASPPDIDLDFPRDIRERLILKVFDELGWERAALTAMIPTYRLPGVVRDVGRALGLPAAELAILAQRAESHSGADLEQEMDKIPQLAGRQRQRGWRDLIALGAQLQGFPKGLSQHPGGMIISSEPLVDMVPVQPSAIPGRYICQWDKYATEDAGFVKIDFLALGTLSQMQECLQLIEDRTGRRIDLSRIDHSDPAVYADLGRGDTVGVFQVESAAQMQTIKRMRPRHLYDMALQVAAVRPGVGANDGVTEFLRRRHGQSWDYDHPLERRALAKSLGIILFQDQVVQLGMDVGGLSAAEADLMRRAFQRRNNQDLIGRYWHRFREGARDRGVPAGIADRIFKKFNPHYMFPEAHALAFGATAYHMAWLRHYFPAEFYCAIFNAQPMGFWSIETLKEDALRRGIRTLGPDVNRSHLECRPEGPDTFRMGLGFVAGIAAQSAEKLLAARERGGEFESLRDLIARAGLQQVALEALVKSGACADLSGAGDRRSDLWEVGLHYRPPSPQAPLALEHHEVMPSLAPLSPENQMAYEYQTLRLFTGGHVMETLRPRLADCVLSSRQLDQVPDGARISAAGKVLRRQRPLGKMVFMTLQDEFGMIPLAIWPSTWQRHRNDLSAPLVLIEGVMSRRDGSANIMVDKARRLSAPWSPDLVVSEKTHDWG
ncbi:MAG: DNA polymerase III subunit alpha [Chloroflexi bacterium]|nr:DNA polymerase III subunit alpha [Chloroflexota bacterium]MDE2701560.1 DNA polymerase III subunit alpha [Chloroflexota bacterium]